MESKTELILNDLRLPLRFVDGGVHRGNGIEKGSSGVPVPGSDCTFPPAKFLDAFHNKPGGVIVLVGEVSELGTLFYTKQIQFVTSCESKFVSMRTFLKYARCQSGARPVI